MVLITIFLYPPISFLTKLSIFLLYLRAFGPNEKLRRLTYAAIVVSIVGYSGMTVAAGVTCLPHSSETFAQSTKSRRCFDAILPRSIVFGTFNIVLNLFIYILPLPVIWRLQMPVRRKVGISCIFATGLW